MLILLHLFMQEILFFYQYNDSIKRNWVSDHTLPVWYLNIYCQIAYIHPPLVAESYHLQNYHDVNNDLRSYFDLAFLYSSVLILKNQVVFLTNYLAYLYLSGVTIIKDHQVTLVLLIPDVTLSMFKNKGFKHERFNRN